MGIKVEHLSFAYGENIVIKDLSFQLDQGQFISLIGPNGSGKSTLLKAMLDLDKSRQGRVLIDGKNLKDLKHKERAQKIAFLPQNPVIREGMTIKELVSLGRYHHKKLFRPYQEKDRLAVDEAIHWVGLENEKEQSVLSLSGGQRQRAFLAMTLAQEADYIFLDEPTAYLDINYQLEFIELLKSLQTEFGKTIVIVLHDLPLVAKYSDHILTLQDGRLYASGSPHQLFTQQMLGQVFGIQATVRPIADSQGVLCYDFRKAEERP